MNKAEFLKNLEKELNGIPQLEKERLMNYYNETIEDAMEDGMSEEDAIKSLGSMKDIVKQINMEHESTASAVREDKSTTLRRIVVYATSPFWLTAIALLATLYLVYLTLILVLMTVIVALIIFVLTAFLNICNILLSNFASGIVLLGCMLFALGILPWIYWLTIESIKYAKILYEKGQDMIKTTWQKAVA